MDMKMDMETSQPKQDQYGVILYSKDQALDPCPLCVYAELDIDTEPCKNCRHRIPGDAYYGFFPFDADPTQHHGEQ